MHSVREQLSTLLTKIGIDTTLSCGSQREPFLKCLLNGLFLNIAQRVSTQQDGKNTNNTSNNNGKLTKYDYEQQKLTQMHNNMNSMNSSSSVTTAGQGRFHFSNNNPNDNTSRNKWSGNVFSSKNTTGEDDTAPYRTVRSRQPVHIHPSSVLFSMINSRKLPEYVVYAELLITSKQYMRTVSVVDGAWLMELFPNSFRTTSA